MSESKESGPACKLCLKSKDLVSSHFMPAALYKYCRDEKHRPLKISDGFVMPSDHQTQAPLLCNDCEDVLSRGGETWIGNKLAARGGPFPLYDLLTKQSPHIVEGDTEIYFAANNPEIKTDKIIHFAMGVFWKAAIWPWRGNHQRGIDLGPYENVIRTWLLGESDFPKHVYLVACLSRPQRALAVLKDPYQTKERSWHTYIFSASGLICVLYVGNRVDTFIQGSCIRANPMHPIFVSDELTAAFAQTLSGAIKRTRRTRAFETVMQKIRKERGL